MGGLLIIVGLAEKQRDFIFGKVHASKQYLLGYARSPRSNYAGLWAR
jgi:hypothetical protein